MPASTEAQEQQSCGGAAICAYYWAHTDWVPPTYASQGAEAVTLYNIGTQAWTAGHYWLSYHLYNNDNKPLDVNGYMTVLPSAVAPGQNVTITAPIQTLNSGAYKLAWDMYTNYSGGVWFENMSPPVLTQVVSFTIAHSPPIATYTSPTYDGATLSTLTPTLSVNVKSDGTQTVTALVQACLQSSPSTCYQSGWLTPTGTSTNGNVSWQIPAGKLTWDTAYIWNIKLDDGGAYQPWTQAMEFASVVAQPKQVELGSSPSYLDDQDVNMFLGQYVRTENDLNLGPTPNPLEITRTYNSSDATPHAFGISWGSALDANWVWGPGKTSFTVTLPDGSSRTFAQNPDGTWAGGWGDPSDHTVDPTNDAIVEGSVRYTFSPSDGLIASIAPDAHHALAFDQTGGVITDVHDLYSNRYIYLTWSGGHVQSESTNESGSLNLTWTFGYNASGTLASVCSPRSSTACTQYTYDSSNRLTKVTPPAGTNTVAITYATDNTVSTIAYPDGTWTYTRTTVAPNPDPSGALETQVTVQDPAQSQQFLFNANGALLQDFTVGDSVAAANYTYDQFGHMVQATDRDSYVTQYTYDPVVGGVTSITRYRTLSTSFTSTMKRQQPTTVGDDSVGLVLSATDANGHTTTYSYGSEGDGLLRTETDPIGSGGTATTTNVYTCDSGSAPASVNDPSGLAVGTEPCGALASTTDPLGHVTTYSYDAEGDLTREVDPTGKTTNMWYDPNGNLITETVTTPQDPAGATTTFGYDTNGEMTSVLAPAVKNPVTGNTNQLQTTQTFDMDGDLLTKTQTPIVNGTADTAHQRVTTYSYDARDRPTSVTQNGTVTSKTTYTPFGQPATTTNGNGFVTDYTYTALGQLLTETVPGYVNPTGYSSPGSTRTITLQNNAYDYAGYLGYSQDPMGQIIEHNNTEDGLPTQETTILGTGSSAWVDWLHNYTYDPAGNIISDTPSTDGVGGSRPMTMAYDDGNHRTSVTLDPTGIDRTTAFGYDADGNLTSVTASQSGRTETSTTAYDGGGQVSSRTTDNSPNNLTTAYQADPFGNNLSVTDPRGVSSNGSVNPAYSTTSSYDPLEELSTVTQPVTATQDGTGSAPTNQAAVTTYGYDAFGDQTQVKYANGYTVSTTYDALGRKITQTGSATPGQSDGWTQAWTYDNDNNVTSSTDKVGQKTTYTYDALDRISQVTHPVATTGGNAGVDTYVFDDDGHLVSHTDPTGAQTLATYDALGHMVTSTVIDRVPTTTNIETDYTYNDFGDLLTQTDKTTGDTISYTYDTAGERTTKTVTGQGTTTYTYDVAGRVTKEVDPNGTSTATTYDLAGRPTTVVETGSDGTSTRTTTYAYDAAGNRTSSTNARGYTTTYAYDARDQLVTQTDPTVHNFNGTTAAQPSLNYGYDSVGDQTATTTGDLNTTYTTYNNQGQPLTVQVPATPGQTDGPSRTTIRTYDTAGDPLTITRPGGAVITNTYDNLGDLTNQTGTLSGTPTVNNTYGYDLDGRVTSYTEPYGTGQVNYDDRGLPVQVLDWTSTTTSKVANNTYNSLGQLTQASNPAGTANYTYTNGLLATVQEAGSSTGYGLTYDAAGRLTGQTVYQGTLGTTADVNATLTYGYDPFSRMSTASYTAKAGANQTAGVHEDTGTLGYTWDADNNLTAQTATGSLANDTSNQSYLYDEADRLTSNVVTHTNGSTTGTDYTWDADGNRLNSTPWTGTTSNKTDGTPTTYTYDARDRIVSAAGGANNQSVAYTYNTAGDRTATTTSTSGGSQTDTLTYNALSQLITDSRAGPGNYTYDALGRLINQPGDPIALQYSSLNNEPDAGNGWSTLRGPDGQIYSETATNGPTDTTITNPHGDVLALLDTNGDTAQTDAYDPFGNQTTQTTTADDGTTTGTTAPLGWQSSLTNPTTGLVHTENRFYDPTSGQFITTDPAPGPTTTIASDNHYAYGNANPATLNDPTGNSSDKACGSVAEADAVDPVMDGDPPGWVAEAGTDAVACAPEIGSALKSFWGWLTDSGGSAATTVGRAGLATGLAAGSTGVFLAPNGEQVEGPAQRAPSPGEPGYGVVATPAQQLGLFPYVPPTTGPSGAPRGAGPVVQAQPQLLHTLSQTWQTTQPTTHTRSWNSHNVYITYTKVTTYYTRTTEIWSNGWEPSWTDSTTGSTSWVEVIPKTDLAHPQVLGQAQPRLPISGQALRNAPNNGKCGAGGSLFSCFVNGQEGLPQGSLDGVPATQVSGNGGGQVPPPPSGTGSDCEDGDAPNNGVDIASAKFAQKSFSESFSKGGLFGGRSINDIARDLASGAMSPGDVPINVVVRDGNTLITNTRSAQALTRAGVSRDLWNVVDQTGNPLFEELLSGQLGRNGLDSSGCELQ